MPTARIECYNGYPAIVVDGTPLPPMAFTTQSKDCRHYAALGRAGVKVFFVICDTLWSRPDALTRLQHAVKPILEGIPDAWLILRIGLHPPLDWIRDHPEEIMTYDDGSQQKAWLANESYSVELPGMYSLCSDKWRTDGSKALLETLDAIRGLSFAGRIIGYFLAAGGTSEWYPINPLVDLSTGRIADFSDAFRREYGRILRQQYGDEAALRQAWKMPDATFEDPIIPDLGSRFYAEIDRFILDSMRNYERKGRSYDAIDLNPEEDSTHGVFLNLDNYQHVADFHRAWHLGTANTIIHFARTIKAVQPDALVGAFYGSYGCTHFFQSSTAGSVLPILDSKAVDFLAAPGVYNNRHPGGYTAQREMQDSFRLRNTMFIVEEDTRTHLDEDFYRDSMRTYTIEDTRNVMKRDFGRNICEDLYAWWFDQFREGGRYDDPDILHLIKRQQQIADFAYRLDRTKNTQIALIYDQESIHYVSNQTSFEMLDLYRTAELARIGAPVDYYFHNDLTLPQMPDYRLYVMINLFYLSDQERQAIEAKAMQNGQVVVWLYAAGLLNPDRNPKLSYDHVSELTGIKVDGSLETSSPKFKLVADAHPALSLADPNRLYGFFDRSIESSVWVGPVNQPMFLKPLLYAADEKAAVLGRYCNGGKAALALKELPGCTSIFCGAKVMRADLLRSIARFAGCHLYAQTDDCIYANQNFLTIHAACSGRRTLYFPKRCSPYEVYQEQYYAKNVDRLEVSMKEGETLMFSLSGIC